jgi:phosphatidate cytidylyltransferase
MEMFFLVFFVLTFYLLAAGVFYRGKVSIASIGALAAMELYVVFAVSSIVLLRDLPHGAYVYLLVFISAWVTDTGAYFSGKTMGKHKLIPEVSPKKTVEGAIGGWILGVVGLVVYGAIIGATTKAEPQYLYLAIAGGVMSLVSMLGDLIASLLKRHFGIKDFGWLLPGHGGVLDRFDSVFATAPFLFFLYYFIPDFALFL